MQRLKEKYLGPDADSLTHIENISLLSENNAFKISEATQSEYGHQE